MGEKGAEVGEKGGGWREDEGGVKRGAGCVEGKKMLERRRGDWAEGREGFPPHGGGSVPQPSL